jgi:hypothetical protein
MNESIRRLVAAGSFAIAVAVGAPPAAAIDDAAVRGARYLVTQQRATGAFFAPDARADGVAEVVASLVAGGIGGAPVQRALSYVSAHGAAAATKPAYAGRIVMGIVAGGRNPRNFGGVDYVARIKPDSAGSYDPNLYGHALSALGVLAASGRLPDAAMKHIRDHQCPDGGYAYDPGCASAGNLQNALKSNVDTTSLVLCVFVAAGVPPSDPARTDARTFLVSAANEERGYGEYAGRPTNANSTGLALSAIAAIGESPADAPWRSGGQNPAKALRGLQRQSGAFPPNDYATVQAVPGLAGVAYPVKPRRFAASRGSEATGKPGALATGASPAASVTPSGSRPAVASPGTDASIAAAAGPGRAPTKNRGRSGFLIPIAIVGCAGAAEGLRRGRRRWAGSRAH